MAAGVPVVAPEAIAGAFQPSAPVALTSPSGPAWGPPRPFGELFTASFGLVFRNSGWIVRFTIVSLLPILPFAFWAGRCYSDWRLAPFTRMLQRDLAVLSNRPVLEPENELPMLLLSVMVLVVVALLCQAFWAAGIVGTMAAAGRGEKASFGRAVRAGFGKVLGVAGLWIWMTLRVIPWLLLLIIPGIVKLVAWSLATPAYVAGEARSAEDALQVSDRATRGRKWTIFGFLLLMWLIGKGVDKAFSPSDDLRKSIGMGAAFAILGLVAIAQCLLGAAQVCGLWLAWADAIAPRNPHSPAAPYAFRAGPPRP
ncbi:MAG: hypothetical protein K8T20_02610 [Planctomycetes bacterium]|nr:hypothetical protein [Planctomycetota bacterium]